MYRYLLIVVTLTLSGCAFHTKEYVSEIVLIGTNYRGDVYDDGVFYINGEPSIRMAVGCYHRTQLGTSMFPLIPLPVRNESPSHESVAAQPFFLTLAHSRNDRVDLTTIKITVDISGKAHPLRLARKETPENTYSVLYEYAADLRCGEIEDGVLRIRLSPDKTRVYGVQFEEGVKRNIAYHASFVT